MAHVDVGAAIRSEMDEARMAMRPVSHISASTKVPAGVVTSLETKPGSGTRTIHVNLDEWDQYVKDSWGLDAYRVTAYFGVPVMCIR